MTDMRRTLLWVVFIMSLVLLWDGWNKHNGQPTLFGAPISQPQAAASAASGAGAVPAAAQIGAAGAAAALPAAAAASAVPGERVTVQTDVVKATFDSVGASLVRLELTAYPDAQDPSRPVVLFDESSSRRYFAQTGFINATPGAALLPRHLSPFQVVPGDRSLADGANQLSVRFESPEIGGAKLVKTYTFTRGQYTVAVKHELTNLSGAPIRPQIYLQLLRDGQPPEGQSTSMFSSTGFTYTGPAVYTDAKKFQKVEFAEIDKRGPNDAPKHEKTASDGWVAMVQHYFVSAWLLPQDQPREFVSAKVGPDYTVAMVQPLPELAPGATATHAATLYAGPQEENKLAALAPGLELVKDYGVFTIISKPLFWLLDHLHGLIGNWGWSIIALVVLLKIAFYWLNAAAYKSQAKMRAINPRIMDMRERLKDKPQEMQQEMMRIYREEKINPLGGCLPIVVQMPFFIALYWVLLASVEMRGAPWLGWITDLSAKDPLFILPALMTASSLLQVWLGPKAPDPVQAKMMWIMPLAFSFMFFFFPAGLVLYWLVNNLLSIAQQYYINRRLGVA
ncbi:membrane protein insertase YidC [Ideonella sp.]|uniref:membrane protein insertase YidC n=1 Tax=Ideonella sp. TaxID=1929293 RepID=UPI0035AFA49E